MGGLLLALGKEQAPQMCCWRAKPVSLASPCVAHLSTPTWVSGFMLPQQRWLPEQEAGDGAGGQGPGSSCGHVPALPRSPVGTAWTAPKPVVNEDPEQGRGAASRSSRDPGNRAGFCLGRCPYLPSTSPSLTPLPAPRHEGASRGVSRRHRGGELFPSEQTQDRGTGRCSPGVSPS